MIIVKIIGGLGNQMFQYALGRQLSILNQSECRLDVTAFAAYKLHQYSLGCFRLGAALADSADIKRLKTGRWLGKLGMMKQSHVVEKKINVFDREILDLRGNFYLDGYWQTEKYFKGIEPIIKQDFTVTAELAGQNKDVADQITSLNSVSLHVRRGDYATNPETLNIHGLCNLDYYQAAIKLLAARFADLNFFVFSDDHQWVKENIKIDFPTVYVDHNQADKNYEDLRLMSLCRHNIIANSSFSWWGAWLNNNPHKAVIAPGNWFNDPARQTGDMVPSDWIKITS